MAETTPGVWRTIRREFYPWALIVVFVALSAYANSLHVPPSTTGPDRTSLRWLAALPPITSALAWHVLVLPSFGGTDRAAAFRRILARVLAAGVFGYAMLASWESLTDLGQKAGLAHPTALPVCVDGLVLIAALAVWSHRPALAAPVSSTADPASDGPAPESESVAPDPRDPDPTEPAPSARVDRENETRREINARLGWESLDRLREQDAETPETDRPAETPETPAAKRGGSQSRLPAHVSAEVKRLRSQGVSRAEAYRQAKAAAATGQLDPHDRPALHAVKD